MTGSDRWQLVERLYHDALARDERERATYLCDACGTDEALRREVESLLAYARETHGFMQVPAIDLAVGQLSPHREEHVFRVAAEAQLGPYRIIAPLGAGGMGEVYRAHDSRLGRDVALKILSSRVTRDLSAVERFSREARAASALNHPNIITIHEISEADIGRFIVMELVQGTTLRRMIPQPFALDAFAHLGSQMARALAVAHVAGIIHRDVKPENIMVRVDGYVKLLDFGLARLTVPDPAQSEEETTANTISGLPIGTPRYMSPEQVQSGALTAATDIFSLGVVLYELATGHRPFAASSQIGVLHAILSESPQPPSHANAQVPKTLDALILQMLEKDARLRPSASEVEAALAEIGGHRPISGRRPAVIEPIRHSVGRSSERRELREAFEVAAAQRGLLVSVAGEAGIGKTTLVEDVLNELTAADRPYRIGRGGCSERLAGTEAYLPWLEALDSLLRDEGCESATRVMKLTAPSWYQLVASVKVDEGVAREHADAPAASQERLKRELVVFLQEISRQRPLVLFFDDVHWADVSTIDLLAYVATKLATLRVLIVATYRPSELLLSKHPFVAIKLELQGRGACREMPLGFLTREDVEHYLALECPEHDFPADLPALIHAKTEGNPLFMVDLVRHLRSSHVMAQRHGRWILAQSVPDLQRELPQSVRSMIEKKIAQLAATDLRLLVAASVQGYEFDSAVVAKAVGADPADVEERLDVLERVHFMVRLVSERELPDRTVTLRYRFVHVLYQNALYESLRPTRRMSLSAAIAEALLAYQTKDRGAVASEVAMLFQAARDFERAAEYFLLSAEHATQAYAVKEAVALARHGLDALAMLPETPERAQQKLSLQTALGRSLMATVSWGTPEAAAVYTQARDLYQQVGQTSQLFPIIWGLWQYRLGRAEYQAGRELADHLAALARELDNPAFNLLAHQAVGQACWLSGHFEAVPVHAEQAIALYVPHDHHSLATLYGGHDPGVANRSCLAVNLWILGYPDQSLQRSREALGLAHEIGHTYSVAFALLFDAMVHQHRRDAQRARQQAEAAVALATEQKLVAPALLFWAATLRGWALAEQGQIDEGITQLRYGIQGFRSMSFDSLQPYFLALLCEAHVRNGHVEHALTVLAEALAVTERTSEGYVEAELYRLKGELLTEPAEKETAIRQAIEIARRQKAKSFELRAVISLSKLYEQEGPQAEARQMLSETHGWFREGFDTADLKEAAALLERF